MCPKNVLGFCSNFFRWSSGDINVRKFGKSAKNFFYRKKIQLQLSKSGGFWEWKRFRRSLETWIIISWLWDNFPNLAVLRITFFIGKYSNFNFQNRGDFVKKNVPKIYYTSIKISLNTDNLPYFTKKFEKYFEVEKKSNFNFQNRWLFGKKNQNPTI